jgi:1-acyl-sn-glycerol-3-phosphate acyltransferase
VALASPTKRTRAAFRLLRWSRMVGHAALGALLLRTVYSRTSPDRRRRLLRWWSAKLLRILNISALVEGPAPGVNERGAMIAANHVSWLDIFLISSVRPTCFIAKSEVLDWGVAGWMALHAGTLFVRRDQWRDATRVNEIVRAALAEGQCVGLFPEGVTTEGDVLLKFHPALFQPAVANDAHVHPAAIRYERRDGSLCREMSFRGERTFMESLRLIIDEPSVVARLSFAQAVETSGIHRRDVALRTRRSVAGLLGLA